MSFSWQNHEIDLNILGCEAELPEILLAHRDQELFKSSLENNALREIQIKLGLCLGGKESSGKQLGHRLLTGHL